MALPGRARALKRPLELAAAYDPGTGVTQAVGPTMAAEGATRVMTAPDRGAVRAWSAPGVPPHDGRSRRRLPWWSWALIALALRP